MALAKLDEKKYGKHCVVHVNSKVIFAIEAEVATRLAESERAREALARRAFMAGATWHAGSIGNTIDFAALAEAVTDYSRAALSSLTETNHA